MAAANPASASVASARQKFERDLKVEQPALAQAAERQHLRYEALIEVEHVPHPMPKLRRLAPSLLAAMMSKLLVSEGEWHKGCANCAGYTETQHGATVLDDVDAEPCTVDPDYSTVLTGLHTRTRDLALTLCQTLNQRQWRCHWSRLRITAAFFPLKSPSEKLIYKFSRAQSDAFRIKCWLCENPCSVRQPQYGD